MDLALVDHIVVAAPDVDEAVAELEGLLGVALHAGGQHPAWGTRNRILPLGPRVYLEVIGPDATQVSDGVVDIFGLDRVVKPSLVAWALATPDLHSVARRAKEAGLPVGEPIPGRRVRGDGTELAWTLTDPAAIDPDSLVPFLIRWSSPHPAQGWSGAVELLSLEGEHPRPHEASHRLATLAVDLSVAQADRPGLIATLRGPKGEIRLRR